MDVQPTKDLLDDVVGGASDTVAEKLNNATAVFQDAVQEGFGSPTPASPPVPAKVLDFGTKVTEPVTPSTPFVASKDEDAEGDYHQFILDTLLWTNKVRSTFYFAGGLLVLLLARYIVSAETSLLSALSYFLLLILSINFLRGIVNKNESGKWSGSSAVAFVVSSATNTVNGAAALVDRYLNGLDAVNTLKVSLVLWTVALLARAISGIDLVIVLFVAVFTLPLAYNHKKEKVDTVLKDVYTKVVDFYTPLDRIKKALFLVIPILLFIALSHRDRWVALFLFLVYGRVLLKPSEVDGLQRKVITPATKYAASAFKSATKAAGKYADKFELTPTPSKKKSQ